MLHAPSLAPLRLHHRSTERSPKPMLSTSYLAPLPFRVNLSWLERATKAIPIGHIANSVLWSLRPVHTIGDLRLVDSNARHAEPDFEGLGEVRAAMVAVRNAGCHCDWRGVFKASQRPRRLSTRGALCARATSSSRRDSFSPPVTASWDRN